MRTPTAALGSHDGDWNLHQIQVCFEVGPSVATACTRMQRLPHASVHACNRHKFYRASHLRLQSLLTPSCSLCCPHGRVAVGYVAGSVASATLNQGASAGGE